jgi:hypothetical protein
MKRERHCELVPAKKYYGKHATGSVVLVNGHCEFHGTTKEAKEFYKRITKAVAGLKDLADTLMTSAAKHFGVPKNRVTVTIEKDRRRKS